MEGEILQEVIDYTELLVSIREYLGMIFYAIIFLAIIQIWRGV